MTPPPRLRTVFLGTPAFALPSLEATARETEVLAVVTQPDRPAGRGRRMASPPVAVRARALGLPVLQPARLKGDPVVAELARLAPDLLVTVAYGRILPAEILRVPPLGCINLHPSLLPKYRGPSPIQAAIAAGETQTGVTVMFQSEDLDAGDIILQRVVPIGPRETAATLQATLAQEGAQALTEALRLLAAGQAPRRPQDPAQATYCKKLTKADGAIDWRLPAETLDRLIRAMDPWPSAYTRHRGRLLKIWQARPTAGADGPPGTVLAVGEAGFTVRCGDGALDVLEVQPEAGRRMRADDYARGVRLRAGERLGE